MSVQKCTGIFIWEFFVCGGHAEDTAAGRKISGAETGEDEEMKRILITGAGSYIGTSFEKWLSRPQFAGMYQVDTVDMRGDGWRSKDFHGYDTVFYVAGIAHKRMGKSKRYLYYKINRDLTIKVAQKAKKDGVKQFINMSSMSVYGATDGVITKKTKPVPVTDYGKSKLQADEELTKLQDENFLVAIVRPPMVYGKGCKGNYHLLEQYIRIFPVFVKIKNERSMIYVKNLVEFIRYLVNENKEGVFFPQNQEYVCTSTMAELIALVNGKRIIFIPFLGKVIKRINYNVYQKMFGNLRYEKVDLCNYVNFEKTICK